MTDASIEPPPHTLMERVTTLEAIVALHEARLEGVKVMLQRAFGERWTEELARAQQEYAVPTGEHDGEH